MRHDFFPTKGLALFLTVATMSACTFNSDLREFRNTIPTEIVGLNWPELLPVGDFGALREFAPAPDTRPLAQRAAELRGKANALIGPVLDPARARAMRAALSRYNQG